MPLMPMPPMPTKCTGPILRGIFISDLSPDWFAACCRDALGQIGQRATASGCPSDLAAAPRRAARPGR